MARLIFLDPEIHDLFCAGGLEAGPASSRRSVSATGEASLGLGSRRSSQTSSKAPRCSNGSGEEHGVVKRMAGSKTFQDNPLESCLGVIELDWDRLTVPGSGGQVLMVYSARPGTRGATALSLLATLAATAAQPG